MTFTRGRSGPYASLPLYPQANAWGPQGYISSDHICEKGQIYTVAFSFSLYHKYPTIGHNNISADMAINV